MSSKMQALIVGVSEYELVGATNLPACKNDAEAISDALQRDCFFNATNIQVLTGKVSIVDFYSELKAMLSYDADIAVVYFSGHGDLSESNTANLVLSDGLLPASLIVERCQRLCKTAWLIFDMCHAGAISFNVERWRGLSAKANEGCVLFTSCAPDMFSYIDAGSSCSVFTNMLVTAIGIVRPGEGKKSLSDIEQVLHRLVKIHNQTTDNQQQPIFYHLSGGSIVFPDPNFSPYQWRTGQFPETDLFKVNKIEPCFAVRKRYSCKVVMKTLLNYETLIKGLPELICLLKTYETYDTELQRSYWKDKKTEVLFIYFANDEEDYINSLFSYCVIWSNRKQDEKLGRGIWCDEAQCWIHEQWSPSLLKEMRRHYSEGAIADSIAIQQAKDSLDKIASCASEVFVAGDRWLGGLMSMDMFCETIEAYQTQIEESLETALKIGYPSKNLRLLKEQIVDLVGALSDLPLFFLGNGRNGRTEENLKQCFNIIRRQYDNARMRIAEIVSSEAL